jgi:hypothetical protein
VRRHEVRRCQRQRSRGHSCRPRQHRSFRRSRVGQSMWSRNHWSPSRGQQRRRETPLESSISVQPFPRARDRFRGSPPSPPPSGGSDTMAALVAVERVGRQLWIAWTFESTSSKWTDGGLPMARLDRPQTTLRRLRGIPRSTGSDHQHWRRVASSFRATGSSVPGERSASRSLFGPQSVGVFASRDVRKFVARVG